METATKDSIECQKTNDLVLEQIQPHVLLLNIIERGKLKYCRHFLRNNNSLEKLIMQGKVKEIRKRGRPRRKWLDEITEKLGLNLETTLKLATIRMNGERQLMKSPGVDIDLTNDDDAVHKRAKLKFLTHFYVTNGVC